MHNYLIGHLMGTNTQYVEVMADNVVQAVAVAGIPVETIENVINADAGVCMEDCPKGVIFSNETEEEFNDRVMKEVARRLGDDGAQSDLK